MSVVVRSASQSVQQAELLTNLLFGGMGGGGGEVGVCV